MKLAYRTTTPSPDDPEVVAAIVQGYEHGLSMRATASSARIAQSTLEKWLYAGRDEVAKFDAGQVEELGSHGRLCMEIERAYLSFETNRVSALYLGETQGGKGWIAALAWLRSRNAQWSETQKVESHATHDVNVYVELPAGPEQSLLGILQRHLTSGLPQLPAPGDTHSPKN